MITLSGIEKRFGELRVLAGVSLEPRPGAITALVGPNGCGKTTLLKILLGLARADAGSVRFDGRELDPGGEYRRALGYMPQSAAFPAHLRVADVIELMSTLRPGAEQDLDLVHAYGLPELADRQVGTLSGGTRQKLNAAVAFLFRPRVLVLDEPTAGLDPVAAVVLRDKLREVRSRGAEVLITSHVLPELEELADDIAFLCDGVLRFHGTPMQLQALTGTPRLEAAIAALLRASAPAPEAAGPAAPPMRATEAA